MTERKRGPRGSRGEAGSGRTGRRDGGAKGRAAGRAPRGGGRSGSSQGAAPAEGKRYYRIGEVAGITGVKPYVLRYWESEFRWMAPAKSRSQQRLYRQRDIEIIQLIKRLLYEERFTIAGARRKLQELGVGRALASPQLDLHLEGHPREQLRHIRNELEEIRASLL